MISYTYVCICVYICVCVYVCVYMCICMCVYIYMCMCVYVYVNEWFYNILRTTFYSRISRILRMSNTTNITHGSIYVHKIICEPSELVCCNPDECKRIRIRMHGHVFDLSMQVLKMTVSITKF